MSATANFAKQLGAEICEILGGAFKYKRGRLELSRSVLEGHDVVILSVNGKYSPHASVAFYFGKNYKLVKEIEQSIGDYQFPYHVQQYSPYRQPLFSSTYDGQDHWDIDIQSPPKNFALDVARAIQGMAFPFFEQFQSASLARDCIASGSKECFSGPSFWRQLLLLDAAMNDLDHFHGWATCLDDWTRNQADQELEKVAKAMRGVA